MPTGDYEPDRIEGEWQEKWVDAEVYVYDGNPDIDPNTAYSIDTPPPTVSGSLHMGHLYGQTLQDFAARYHRMAGEEVMFPFGYDDNGIASERLTEDELGIRHGDFSRREFQEKCREVCQEYEAEFTEKVQELGTSIDWNRTYKTIEPRVQKISQLSFLDLYEQGREYRKKAPAIWCPECETAISQAEMEDANRHTHFNDIRFDLAAPTESGRESFVIGTTRPELLPACVSVFVHPDDEENADLIGEIAEVPLFGHEVPIIEDDRVDLEKGTGVVMCCTFGDQKDIEWYQAHDLPLRVAIDESGTMTDIAEKYEGLSTKEARELIIEDLNDAGYLVDREPHEHAVQVHERCEVDVEYRVSRQWYIEILDHKEEYLEAGREMDWYPEKMFTRYEHWIEGLEWDWLISRQRDSGIPFPVWYCTECNHEVLAERDQLPADPLSDDPPVHTCPECGHDAFRPEEDVLDTWATSSLTPLINADWDPETLGNGELAAGDLANPELYPFSIRPQAHDIISFWLFHTVVKCYEHTGNVPFDTVMIHGHVLDENREKMSKSKGNVVKPSNVVAEYPVDAIRYWAASSGVGDDFPFNDTEIVAGEKLIRKLWNASKLVDSLTTDDAKPPSERDAPAELDTLDEWLLAELDDLVADLTAHFDEHEYAKARSQLRTFFWHTFCDDYLEIAKERDTESTRYALTIAHETFLKLWAPIMPHVTEELWHEMYVPGDGESADPTETSIHLADWPEVRDFEADLNAGETAMEVISALRKYKADHQLALNADLEHVEVFGSVAGFEDAIKGVMHVDELTLHEDDPDLTTEVVDIDLDYSTLGPKYGDQINEFDAAIADGDYEIVAGELRVGGETLVADEFEVREEHKYGGDGKVVETDHAVVVVH